MSYPQSINILAGRSRHILLHALLFAAMLLPASALSEKYTWTGVDRVVAISDVHGAFDAMVQTLTRAGILDQEQKWAAGKTQSTNDPAR